MRDALRLDNQLCFALYAASRAMTAAYRPALERLGLTYPQYLVLLVLWEADDVPLKTLSERLQLDSGTLTPLVKRLGARGLVEKARDPKDERSVRIRLTEAGRALEADAESVPRSLLCMVDDPAQLEGLAEMRRHLTDLTRQLVAHATSASRPGDEP